MTTALVAVAVLAAACTSGGGTAGPTPKATGVSWSRSDSRVLRNPSGSARADDAVVLADGTQVVGGQDRAPGADHDQAAVWESRSGTSWQHVDAPALEDGTFIPRLATDGTKVVAVGGGVAKDHRVPRAWVRSTSGRWTRVSVDDRAGPALLEAVTAGGGTTTVVGLDEVDGAKRVVVASAATGRPLHLHAGPAADHPVVSQAVTFAGGIWALGSTLVGGRQHPVLWSTPDHGRTWSTHVDPAGDQAPFLAGLAVHGGKLWLAGTAVGPDAQDRFGLWTSPDGSAWTRIPVEWKPGEAVQGYASAIAANDHGVMVGGESGSSFWFADGATAGTWWKVPDSLAATTSVGAIASAPDRTTTFNSEPGRFVATSVQPDGAKPAWTDAKVADVPAEASNETVVAMSSRTTGYGVREDRAPDSEQGPGPEVNRFDLSGRGTVSPTNGDLTRVTSIDRAGDRQIVVGTTAGSHDDTETSSDFNDIGVARVEGNDLKTLGTIEGPGEQRPHALLHVGRDWWIGGAVLPSTTSRRGEAAIWHSTDLEHWKPERGPFEGDDDRNVWGLCSALGTEWAVGSIDVASGATTGAVWRRGPKGAWSQVDYSKDPDDALYACAGTADQLLITGSRPRVLTSTDGTAFTSRAVGSKLDQLAPRLLRTPHGYALAGYQDDGLEFRVVVWTSADGLRWTTHAAPRASPTSLGIRTLTVIDGDLLVAGGDGYDGMLWTVRGLPL